MSSTVTKMRSLISPLFWIQVFALVIFLGCGGLESETGTEATENVAEQTFFSRLFSGMVTQTELEDCPGLMDWLRLNPTVLTEKFVGNGFTIVLELQLAECLACKDLPKAKFIDSNFIKQLADHTGTTAYVMRVVRNSDDKGRSFDPFVKLTERNVMQVIGSDSIPCAFLHFEASPAMAPHRTALLGFETASGTFARQVLIRDTTGELGGDISFHYSEQGFTRLEKVLSSSLKPV